MRDPEEKQFVTHDGVTLFYRYWPALERRNPQRAVVIFHRGHEHSGRLQHIVDELGLAECAMFAWDARGHGRSPGTRGDSPSFAASVKDIDAFARHITDSYGIDTSRIAVIGQSIGAVAAATWVHDYAPRIACLVLTAPAFKVKLYVPFALPALRLLSRLRGNFFINSYVKAALLTHDPQRIRSYDEDPLVTRAISVRVLLGLNEAADRIVADAQAIRVPVQMLLSGSDFVVKRRAPSDFFERLGSRIKQRHVLPGFYHDTLGERDRHLAFDLIRPFICKMFDEAYQAESLLRAHRAGYYRDEELKLSRPFNALAPANVQYAATRLSMRTLGRLADGIRTGLATGFDSGSSLDYVYRNQAHGKLGIGTVIDRGYLDAIGWRGIRQRKQHVEAAVASAAARLKSERRRLHILDIAAGHGRYVLDAIAALDEPPASIRLLDYDQTNVDAGAALIAERKLGAVATFERGDAFDAQALACREPAPTLAIVSGLYELFPDNELVLRSLTGLACAVHSGGYLIYTGQPWHPQLELIARTLTSHREHRPWIMRRRPQEELDELVRSAGFSKVEQWTGDSGIFTVSLARRN